MKRYLLVISIAVLLGGCRPLSLITLNPAGSAEYKLGWEDGCDSGMSAQGGWRYKMVYGFKKRPELTGNDQYKGGWNEGFTYCRFAIASSQKEGAWESVGLGNGF